MTKTETKKCIKCKKTINEDSEFCMFCGAKQNITPRKSTRGNGQGCAYKRGKTWTAQWVIGYQVEPENKKSRTKRGTKSGFKTKAEALEFAMSHYHIANSKKYNPTVCECYKTYIDSQSFEKLSKSRKTATRIAWKKCESIANKPIADLKIGDLEKIIAQKAPTHDTAKDVKTLMSALFKRAVAEGLCQNNLALFLEIPPEKKSKAEAFNEEEIQAFWTACDSGDRMACIILVMIMTGMMPGEILGLKSNQIDFKNLEISGNALKTEIRKKLKIVFPDYCSDLLQKLISSSESKRGFVVGMSRDNFYKEYHDCLKRCGVRDLPPYSCRHTTATELVRADANPAVIQKVMRHSKPTTTARYMHPDEEDAHEAMKALESRISDKKQ
ncbi:MAG: tyrosine-type recombinase/integrase [Candidatus Limivicinus sp.]|jgi:integrase